MNGMCDGPGVVILGAGYHAKLAIEYLRMNGQRILAVLDDDPAKHGTRVKEVPVAGPMSLLPDIGRRGDVTGVTLGFGNVRLRKKRIEAYEWVRGLGLELVSIVHSTAFVSPSAVLAQGLFVGPLALVNVDTRVGENVAIYSGSTIDHDNVISDHVFIGPGVHTAGRVQLDAGAYVGPGAIVGSECRIGAGAIVGAGAVVLEDVPAGWMAAGVPARKLKSVAEWEQEKP